MLQYFDAVYFSCRFPQKVALVTCWCAFRLRGLALGWWSPMTSILFRVETSYPIFSNMKQRHGQAPVPFLRGEAWHGCFFSLKAGDLLLLPGHLQLALLLEPGSWCADGMLLRISVSEIARTDLTDLWQGQAVWGHYFPNSGYGCSMLLIVQGGGIGHDAGLIAVLCSLAYWLLEDDLKSFASTRFRRHNIICHVALLPRLWYGKVRKVFCFCLCFTHFWTSISSSSPAARNFGGKGGIRLFCLDLLCFLV